MENPRISKAWRNVGATDNLAQLSKLDEDIILAELKSRYQQDQIYTYVGDILIAVNPFKDLPIYDKKVALKYRQARLSKDPPHIYAISSHVYRCMLGVEYDSVPHDQCIVISGESGAGKTESTKFVVQQIIELCNGNTRLGQQILQVNPLLEAFGNAKTVINDNSSRFGKYIQIQFNSGKVIGAKISEYLLEKSRVVHQNAGDGNFHMFSYMFAGCSEAEKELYKLQNPNNYRYTQSNVNLMANVAQLKKKYEELQNAMDMVGFSEEEQKDLMSILSGVLSIGNVNFAVNEEEMCVAAPEALEIAAELLGVDKADLTECLTCLRNKARGEQILRNFTKHQAEDARDAVAKVIYGRLFSWIVNKINQLLASQQKTADQHEIGILDIFGFENFVSNSFEQACINLANEHLQFFFNEHIFSLEQEEYKMEGVKWTDITYSDNQPLLDLFLKRPMGILALLDEESHFPQATDATFIHKLNNHMSASDCYKSHKSVGKPRFTIHHYAGEVTYDVTSWLEKNRDTIPHSLMPILKGSRNSLLRTIFKGTITRTGTLALQNRTRKSVANKQAPSSLPSNTKKLTVGAQFKNSLQELIRQMSKSEPHFIRCLKPNSLQQADRFDDAYVLSQLSYTGMLQTVQIRRDGYAFRPLISDFISTYKLLLYHHDVPVDSETCKQILSRANITDWHIGKTKVFLKYAHGEVLSQHLTTLIRNAVKMQAVVRGFLARRYVLKIREVSRQHKLLVESFMRSVQADSEKFTNKQQELQEHDQLEQMRKVTKEDEEKKRQEQAEKVEVVMRRNTKKELAPPVPAQRQSAPRRPPKSERLSSYIGQGGEPAPPVILPEIPTSPLRPTPSVARPEPAQRKTLLRYSEQRTKSVVDKFSGYGGLDEDDEVIEDDYSVARLNAVQANMYGPAGTSAATIEWLRTSQLKQLVKPGTTQLYEWFHGMIPRGKAEKMLLLKGIGTFMLRLSEKRLGYVLSFRAETRCRHYMVELTPSNKYVVVGEAKVHRTLCALVDYYQKNQISNWPKTLTEPCGRLDPNDDYGFLLGFNNERSQSRASRSSASSDKSQSSTSTNGRSAPPLPPKIHPKRNL